MMLELDGQLKVVVALGIKGEHVLGTAYSGPGESGQERLMFIASVHFAYWTECGMEKLGLR